MQLWEFYHVTEPEILKKLAPNGKLILVEQNKEFVEISSQAKDIKENAKKAEEDLNKIEVELDHLASLIPKCVVTPFLSCPPINEFEYSFVHSKR